MIKILLFQLFNPVGNSGVERTDRNGCISCVYNYLQYSSVLDFDNLRGLTRVDVNSVSVMYCSFFVPKANNILHCEIYRGIPTNVELPGIAINDNPILKKYIILFYLNADTISGQANYLPTHLDIVFSLPSFLQLADVKKLCFNFQLDTLSFFKRNSYNTTFN